MHRQYKVLIMDSSAMFRHMLAALLSREPDLEVTGAVDTIAEASDKILISSPDLILTETRLSDGSAIEWLKELKTRRRSIHAIFVTGQETEETMLQALSIGAAGLVFKSASVDTLLCAIRTAASGENISYPYSILEPLGRMIRSCYAPMIPELHERFSSLSRREREIANLIAQGLTYQEIADQLYISVNTIKTHIKRIYKRLNITSRRDLIRGASGSDCDSEMDGPSS